MPDQNSSAARASFERGPAADLWRRTLAQIPTLFGRLVYLSSLRDLNSGAYQHYGLAQAFGAEQAGETLRQSHEQVFAAWLGYGLERQRADLEEYLSELEGGPAAVLGNWILLAPYRNLIPANARAAERDLYLADLEAILELLKHEHGAVVPDPEA